jgi:FkbM family methyltransferase
LLLREHMKYSVIIPTYNHCDDLLVPCIETLLKYSKVSDVELIISANGCKDNTLAYLTTLKETYYSLGMTDNLKIVWNDAALGYSRACNAGIEVATTDLIILLNNDVVFLDQYRNQWLDLFEGPFIKNPKCGISTVLKIYSEPAGHDFAVFFAVMIHRKVFDAIGLLNTEYGVGGGEDTEFCIYAERAGFEVCEVMSRYWSDDMSTHTGNFPIYHKGEGTMHDPTLVPEWDSIFLENSLTLAKKFNPGWYDWMTDQIKTKQIDISFLQEQHNDIYKEVVTENYYNITADLVKDKTVIDIGANIGIFSILVGSMFAKKVYAVEPVSSTFMQLCANINKSKLKNIVPIKSAVTDVAGEFVEVKLTQDFGHNGLYANSATGETVYTTSLNEILRQVEGDDILLKIDCEGSEYDILMNAFPEDMSRVSRIVLESHAELNPKYKGFEILEDKLKSFGFVPEDLQTVFSWDINERGERINWKVIPYRIEIWKR